MVLVIVWRDPLRPRVVLDQILGPSGLWKKEFLNQDLITAYPVLGGDYDKRRLIVEKKGITPLLKKQIGQPPLKEFMLYPGSGKAAAYYIIIPHNNNSS